MKDGDSWRTVEIGKVSDLFTQQTLYAYREESPQKDTSLFLDGIKQRGAYLTFLNYASNGQLGRDDSVPLDSSAYGTSSNEFYIRPFTTYLGVADN